MTKKSNNGGNGPPGDYEVGYGKTPKHSRWKKGQSGNPKGRKKGARGLKSDLDDALKEQLTITVNGKQRKGTTQSHAMYAVAVKAAAGDMRASRQFTDLILNVFGPGDRGSSEARLSPLDQELLERWLERSGDDEASDEQTEPPEPTRGKGRATGGKSKGGKR